MGLRLSISLLLFLILFPIVVCMYCTQQKFLLWEMPSFQTLAFLNAVFILILKVEATIAGADGKKWNNIP